MKTRYLFLSLGALSLSLVYGCGSSSSPSDDSNLGGATSGGTGGTGTGSAGTGSNGSGAAASGGAGTGGSNEPVTMKPLEGIDGYDCSAPTGTIPGLKLAPIVDGLEYPVLMTHAPNDEARLFVLEQTGKIRVVTDLKGTPTLESAAFLDVSSLLPIKPDPWLEFGLLGLAFHPQYEENGLFYVHYNVKTEVSAGVFENEAFIAEYKVSDENPNVANPSSARVLLNVADPADNHNGGSIVFGSDGMLYIGFGDGGGANDQYGNGQKVTDLLGSVLRIDVDGRDAGQYGIPTGNLKDEVPSAAPEVWDYGLRNPYRMNFDGCTGYLYIGDVGQNKLEEVDIELANSGHKNYGWSTMEGTQCFDAETCDKTGLTLPFAEFENTSGSAIIGGAVYRGTKLPSLRGTYVYGDYGTGRFWRATFDGETLSEPISLTDDLGAEGKKPRAIQNGGDGEIYVVFENGDLMRIEAD